MKYLKRVKCKPWHAIIGVSVKLCEQPGNLWQRRGTPDWATLSPNDDYFFSIRILDYSFACYNTMRRSAPSRPHYVFIVDQPSEMALPCVVLSLFLWLMLSTDFGQAGVKERYEMSSWCHLASTYKKIAAYFGARTTTEAALEAGEAAAVANVLVAAKDSPPAKLMKPIN